MAPGVAHSYESCAEYDPIGEPGESADRGGCVNVLSPSRFITPMSSGMANNSCLVQIENGTARWTRRWHDGWPQKWNMVIDLALCNDCNCCFMADKDEFTGNDGLPFSAAQPWEGARWLEHRAQRARTVPPDPGGTPSYPMHAL